MKRTEKDLGKTNKRPTSCLYLQGGWVGWWVGYWMIEGHSDEGIGVGILNAWYNYTMNNLETHCILIKTFLKKGTRNKKVEIRNEKENRNENRERTY